MGNHGGWGPPPPGPQYPQQYGTPPGPAMQHPYGMVHQPHAGWAPSQVPSTYKNIGILMLISGIKSVILSLALIVSLVWFCVGLFWFITLAGAIMEIVIGATIMSGKPTVNARTIAILGLVNAVLCGNIIGVVLEAIALSQLGRPEVEHYVAYAR